MGEDKLLFDQLRRGDQNALKQLFALYYEQITGRLYKMVPDLQLAEDMVQEVFINLWQKREQIRINTSVQSYLMVSARNRLFNHLRANKHILEEIREFHVADSTKDDAQKEMEQSEIQRQVHRAIDRLPIKSRTVFVMSRFEEMSYKEIALSLGVSVKVVEYHMSKALKELKQSLLNIKQ